MSVPPPPVSHVEMWPYVASAAAASVKPGIDSGSNRAVVHHVARVRDGEAGEQAPSLGPMFISLSCRAARVDSGLFCMEIDSIFWL